MPGIKELPEQEKEIISNNTRTSLIAAVLWLILLAILGPGEDSGSSSAVLTSLSHLRYYLVSMNLNYFYNFGFLLGVSIFLQTVSGIFLTLIYYSSLQLYSNIYSMTFDFYYGYLYRYMHIVFATIINVLLVIHIFKGLLYTNFNTQIYTHYSGFVLYVLIVVISYLGYILTYGQLSYWGATVIINLLPVQFATLILGSYAISPITISRYLIFHMLLSFILYFFILIHIFYLHSMSSQSPVPVSVAGEAGVPASITFLYFIFKDVTSLLSLLTISVAIALFTMLTLSHPINMIPINSLVTPSHIVPEWYFLYLYSVLKIIPSKLGGILGVVISLLFILLLTTSSFSSKLNSYSLSGSASDTVIAIVLSYLYLSFIGLQLPIAPYIINCRLFLVLFTLPVFVIPYSSMTNLKASHYIGAMSTTNHKRIGLYYLLTSSYIAIMGIILSIIMRIELSSPSSVLIASSNVSFYNYSISNHGLLMLLFIVMPIVFGAFGNYLLVLTLGLIDIVFPRINNLGWLILVLSYLIIQYSILTEYLTGAGWTLYPPLSTITSTFIISSMYLALSISGVSSLLTSINYLLLLPYILAITDLLLISFTITSIMVLYSIPVLAGAFLLATSDILLTTSYFSNYSDPVLYQHLFWFFGHPEVYILILPSFGLINYQLSSLTSNYIFGTISMILALISILLFGSIVWSHHMFTVNLESDTNLYFTILTLIIAIPTGTKLYNWLYVTAGAFVAPSALLPLALAYIFLIIVIQGGVTGVVLGNNILDLQLHDTYYVVSHFHYILSVATAVSIILTLYYLSSYFNALRVTQCMHACMHSYSLITIFILLNTIFLPMYFLGFNTMPRRIPDYADYLQTWNSVSSISVLAFYISILIMLLL
jgi:cytochrome c oxidase subunit 1